MQSKTTIFTCATASLLLLAAACSHTPDGAANPRVANPCATNPCAMQANPCDANPCAGNNPCAAADGKTLLAAYRRQAEALLAAIKNGAGEAALIERTQALLDQSTPVLARYRQAHPGCTDYLDAADTVREQLATISHATIEHEYHHDGALPQAPGKCYSAKDMLVHPATVLVVLREQGLNDDTRKILEAEIAEVIGHLHAVELPRKDGN